MLSLLRLLQLADSALPIGGLSHSFGLETMIEEGDLAVADLFAYLQETLSEGLLLDAVFCRCAHRTGVAGGDVGDLNARLNALRLARESRDASLALGKRFLTLVNCVASDISVAIDHRHFSIAFGYICGRLEFDAEVSVAAFLQQSIAASISVCQRLMPLGQLDAARIAWDLKPHILETAAKSAALTPAEVSSFAHLPELASMRHPTLTTRLFVS